MNTYTHIHTHIHTYTYIHTYIYTPIGEVENNANIELDKIANWARDNKIKFNEETKSNVTDETEKKNRKRLQCI